MDRSGMRLAGSVSKPFGTDGTLIIKFDPELAENISKKELVFIETAEMPVPFFIERFRFRNNRSALVRFLDYDCMELVNDLVGCRLYLPEEKPPSPAYPFKKDVSGFKVYDEETGFVGQVNGVIEQEMNSLLVIENKEGEVLIPLTGHFITRVDYKKHIIDISVPEDLLKLNRDQD